jgi:hypothetical protein
MDVARCPVTTPPHALTRSPVEVDDAKVRLRGIQTRQAGLVARHRDCRQRLVTESDTARDSFNHNAPCDAKDAAQ